MNYYEHHLGEYAAARDRRRRNQAIRSERMAAARARGTHTKAEWDALVRRFGGRCVRCGTSSYHVERDHITPVYQGGSDSISNIQPLCARCNCSKGPESFNWVAYRDQNGFES